ncbi:hypothetical protein CP061683_1016A, partial [Chlamydia psittaci 06-1683]|jgi:hypothetical protein
MVAS